MADRIQGLSSSDKVDISGDREEEWTLILNDQQLAYLGIGLPEVMRALAEADVRIAAGAIDEAEGRVNVQVDGSFDTRQRISEVPVLNSNGGSVLIGDLARIERGWASPAVELSRVNGQPAILVSAQLQKVLSFPIGLGKLIASEIPLPKNILAAYMSHKFLISGIM